MCRRLALRAHFKTWCDGCSVSVEQTVFCVGFLHFGSVLVGLRRPNGGFEMRFYSYSSQPQRTTELRFSGTLGRKPEIEVALVWRLEPAPLLTEVYKR